MAESLHDGGDCRTAPATPGLLMIMVCKFVHLVFKKNTSQLAQSKIDLFVEKQIIPAFVHFLPKVSLGVGVSDK